SVALTGCQRTAAIRAAKCFFAGCIGSAWAPRGHSSPRATTTGNCSTAWRAITRLPCYLPPPMPFQEIAFQDRALKPLRAALERGTLHHAYLFGGPQGVGKAIAARVLAQAANCELGGPDACGTC